MLETRVQVDYPRYFAYYICGMPISICLCGDLYKEISKQAESKQICLRFRQILLSMVAMILFSEAANQDIRHVWEAWVRFTEFAPKDPGSVAIYLS